MAKHFSLSKILLVTFLSVFFVNSFSQEKVMFDDEITWSWPINNSYGGNSFYWWHYTRVGNPANLGEMPSTSWLSPANYWEGNIYLRFEVIDQPSNEAFQLQMGIWQDNGSKESVSNNIAKVPGGAGSVVEVNLGSPKSWYVVYPTLDFSRPGNFDRIGLVLWTNSGSNTRGCIPMAQGWNNSAACSDATTLKDRFFPMQARLTVVACASGTAFSGWNNYTGGSTRNPTPAYTIDYENERTTQIVPSTDEYSYSSNMSGAVSGTGVRLGLTPGTIVYFRTKASGGLLESLVQTLIVKNRPSNPSFSYDAANGRTLQTISSAYEYSTNSDMSDAITGSGNYVSFDVGTTMYFRKKATTSDFKSGIQALTGEAKAPTPNYTIDFINETTNEPVPLTDEYSYNQSSWANGSGNKLVLSPGTDVYFRTKASGGNQASDVQHLDVPSRPVAPSFTYDATNQRTTQVVSNAYEYSSNSNMSDAVVGTGSYVSFSIGSTRYFRKLATASSFKSNIQTLTGTGSGTTSNIGPEFVIINEIIEYPNSTDDNGFYFFYYNTTMPSNWMANYNYYLGQIYTRYEILEQVSSEPIGLQFGIWQKLPDLNGTLYENMETVRTLNGPGSVVTSNSSLSSFWTYNGGCDFTQMNKVWHFGINPYKVNGPGSFTQIRSENAEVWASRNTHWFPIKVRVTVVAVAQGHTFSGWENYIGDGTTPAFEIDYVNQQTATTIENTVEYSTDKENWITGNGTKVSLTPGQDMYFRKKNAPAYIQQLVVPAKGNAPTFAIDFINEKTSTAVSSEFEYSNNINMTNAVQGSGQPIALVPSSSVYIRKKATSNTFSSNIQTLAIPARPAGPVYTIDFINSRTNENVPSTVEYSQNESFTTKANGNSQPVEVTPGSVLYFRSIATATKFKSNTSSLIVPAKPAVPNFGINYLTERTSASVSSDYEYSLNSNMSSPVTGANTVILLIPGSDLYIARKATSTAFRSEIQHLIVPERPAPPYITINFETEKTAQNIESVIHYSSTSSFTSTHEGMGIPVNLTPGQNMCFKFKATSNAFASNVFELNVPQRPFISFSGTIPTSNNPLTVSIQFPTDITGFEASDIQVTNGTVSSITGNYNASIIPLSKGNVSIQVKANSVAPSNFASARMDINFQGVITDINKPEIPGLRVYPNVVSTLLVIEGESIAGSNYSIYNTSGVLVQSGLINQSQQELNVDKLISGIYYLLIRNHEIVSTVKFIKN